MTPTWRSSPLPESTDLSALQLLLPGAQALLDAVADLPGVSLLAPPHVSLGYPWLPTEAARERLDAVRAAAAGVPAFSTRLTGPYRFDPDRRGRVVLHARLSDEGPVRALATALGADLRAVHLSLARVTPTGDPDAVEAALAPLLPRDVAVTELELTVRVGGTWSTALVAPLGVSAGRAAGPASGPTGSPGR